MGKYTKKKRNPKGGSANPFQICSDANECISFGTEDDKIKEYFFGDNFFKYADNKNIKHIGSESNNGFIVDIPFNKHGNTIHALLKSTKTANSDNLVYEGWVGSTVNTFSVYFPCFVETYALGKYNDNKLFTNLQTNMPIKKEQLNDLTLSDSGSLEDIIHDSCVAPMKQCILIENLKNIRSLNEIKDVIEANEMMGYLFQVYFVLDTLKNNFTHYDLHSGNVLVYSPSPKKNAYVTMIYHYSDGSKVEMKTFGIIKLIDYGRSFVHYNKKINSRKYFEILCATPECDPACGDRVGYNGKYGSLNRNYHINSSERNMSHDLRLLNDIKLNNILGKVVYLDEKGYGTPENKTKGYKLTPPLIFNVTDAHMLLKQKMQNMSHSSLFTGKRCIGKLEIWEDKQTKMVYTPSVRSKKASLKKGYK
jgi:hypothetical protein